MRTAKELLALLDAMDKGWDGGRLAVLGWVTALIFLGLAVRLWLWR